jgi:hypothetical protein
MKGDSYEHRTIKKGAARVAKSGANKVLQSDNLLAALVIYRDRRAKIPEGWLTTPDLVTGLSCVAVTRILRRRRATPINEAHISGRSGHGQIAVDGAWLRLSDWLARQWGHPCEELEQVTRS